MSEQKRQSKRQRQPKAKTAYELLERVCEAIAREPKRFNQADWCGTAFCRAGWMVLLHDGQIARRHGIHSRADELLGMTYDEAWPLYSVFQLMQTGARHGTPEYAEAGVAGTREFMAKHEAHLKARSLKGV